MRVNNRTCKTVWVREEGVGEVARCWNTFLVVDLKVISRTRLAPDAADDDNYDDDAVAGVGLRRLTVT